MAGVSWSRIPGDQGISGRSGNILRVDATGGKTPFKVEAGAPSN